MAFTCPRCHNTSHHPKDEEYGYCGRCHDFTGDNHFEKTSAGMIDWKLEAERANRLYAELQFANEANIKAAREFKADAERANRMCSELQRVFNFNREADMRACRRWSEATGEDLKLPDRVDLVLYLLQKIETAERIDRVDEALAGRLSKSMSQMAMLREQIEKWSKAYPVSVFSEPDLGKVAELLKAGGVTLDAVSASIYREVLKSVLELIAATGSDG